MEVQQFTCYDAPQRAQVVTIQWERLEADDDCSDRPDERDDGFWPSTDPKAAGYVGPDNVARYDELHSAAEERMEDWKQGNWRYIGIVARAHVSIPIGSGSFRTVTIDSMGCWGIESDAGDYLDTVFEEEKAGLLSQLATLGTWAKEQSK